MTVETPEFGQDRYARQTLFQPIGQQGQDMLKQSRVAIVGMGALGTVIATQLARAGVGFIRLIDRDIVELSNLQRQFLYDESDALGAWPKAVIAAQKLRLANSEINIEAHVVDLTAAQAESLLADVDLILDGTDNFQVRYLINEVAVKHNIAWSYGGAIRSYGTAGLLIPHQTPCFVCLFGEQSATGGDTCDTVGVIAPAVSVIASLQVTEALKYLTNHHEALVHALIYADVWTSTFRKVKFPLPRADCACCGKGLFPHLASSGRDALTLSLCGRHTVQVRPLSALTTPLAVLAQRLQASGPVLVNDHLLQLKLDSLQITLFKDGRALIYGTDDTAFARSIYARYIGM